MSSFYCDISVVGVANEYQAYAADMTIGANATDRPLPMDGNGKSIDPVAASVAVAELQITTNPSAGNTIVIAGATAITAVSAYSAKNQFLIGGTIAATVTNLITCLNTFGTATTVPNCDVTVLAAVCQATLAVPYLYWARLKPGTTDTIQLFTRIAGADFNTANNSTSKIAQTGTWLNSGAAAVNFAEGVDGPFGYFTNNGTIFGKTQCLAGIWGSKSLGATDPTVSDPIFTRTMRGGTSLQCVVTAVAAATITCRAPTGVGRTFIFDNGTTWSGDDGQFQLDLINNNVAYSNFFETGASITSIIFLHALEKYGLRIRGKTSSPGYFTYVGDQGSGSRMSMYQVHVEAYDATSGTGVYLGNRAGTDTKNAFEESKLVLKTNRSPWPLLSANYNVWLSAKNSIFEWQGIGADVSSLLICGGNVFTYNPGGLFEFIGCEFVVDSGAYKVASFMSGGNNITSICIGKFVVENCKGLWNPSLGMVADSNKTPTQPQFYWRDRQTGSFRLEKGVTTSDYVSTSAYPSLNVTTLQGVAMAYRFSWEASRLDNLTQHEVGSFSLFYRGASVQLPVAIELLTPSAEVPTKAEIFAVISYTDSGDVLRTETTNQGMAVQNTGLGADLDAGIGLGSWTLNGVTGVESRKVGKTTDYAVKIGTDINVKLFIGGAPDGTRTIYVNPAVMVS